jgi:signal transduction histidine kinase
MRISRQRLSILIGSESAFSRSVLIGLGIVGFFLSFMYIRLIPGQPRLVSVAVSASAALLSVAVVVIFRHCGLRDGWRRTHAVVVVSGIVVASLVRSLGTSLYVAWQPGGRELDSNPLGRTIGALLVTLVLGLVMAAAAQLSRERFDANTELLAEQANLRRLAESADAELVRSEVELRNRARELLEPSISEIRELISEDLSERDARRLSDRINAAVNDVVRPASREFARSPLFETGETVAELQAPVSFLSDRMDVTQAIRPGWLLALYWGAMVPAPLILGAQVSALARWFVFSVVFALVLVGVKAVWPRRLRTMPIALGLGVLLVLYVIVNLGFDRLGTSLFGNISSSAGWASNNSAGWLIRVALAMLVSILATLHVHGEQTRAILIEVNAQLEELISRIRRESWLMHRSVSLAIHGPVQSVFVSTAMRLSAADRSPETAVDARRRLEGALEAISADQGDGVSLELALEDLQGLWNPLVTISFEISEPARERLTEDNGLRRCVIEICREATSNAIRHGHAKVIDIRVDQADELIEIRVADDGEGVLGASLAGLGTEMFDDTCLRWRLDPLPHGGLELLAVLA